MKANETKSAQVIFTLKKNTCPPVHLNNKQMTQAKDMKYLGIHLDRTLTWHKKHFCKEKTTGPQTPQIVLDYWPKIAVVTG